MGKYEAKTRATEVPVADFIASLPDARRREEAAVLDAMHRRVTGHEPKMWGPSMIGYGSYCYKYASGHEGEAMRAGFSPRKANLSLHLVGDITKQSNALAKLGKHKTGVGCLYINKLEDVDLDVLRKLIETSANAVS